MWAVFLLSLCLCHDVQGLASVVYALALMGYHPGKPWLYRFHCGIDTSQDIPPASMAMLHRAYALLQFSPAAAAAAGGEAAGAPGRAEGAAAGIAAAGDVLHEAAERGEAEEAAGQASAAGSGSAPRPGSSSAKRVSRPSRFAER